MPRPTPDRPFPWEDDSEPPGISIRPLSHADLAVLLGHPHHGDGQDLVDNPPGPARPAVMPPATPEAVVAVRVRATVGRPGASAQATYRRRRAAEWVAWTRSLPWRAAAILAAGAGVGLLAARLAPHLAGPAGLLAAAALGLVLRFRVSADTRAWRRGTTGERRTARLLARLLARLEPHGWAVLHDLAIPDSQANVDCDDPERGGRGAV